MKHKQLTLADFSKVVDLKQQPNETFIEYMERMKVNPNYFKLFIKKKDDKKIHPKDS